MFDVLRRVFEDPDRTVEEARKTYLETGDMAPFLKALRRHWGRPSVGIATREFADVWLSHVNDAERLIEEPVNPDRLIELVNLFLWAGREVPGSAMKCRDFIAVLMRRLEQGVADPKQKVPLARLGIIYLKLANPFTALPHLRTAAVDAAKNLRGSFA